MKIETLEQFYLEELKDLYDAEKQLLKALPRMAKAASNDELKSALELHTEQTEEQVNRLETILKKRGKNSRGRRCKAMLGLIEEGREMMGEKPVPDIMDVGIITMAQKVEHYEIAGYGCTATYAKLLGFKEDLELLKRTLGEEKETDVKLTRLAQRVVNPEAKQAGDDDESQSSGRGRKPARSQARTRAAAPRKTSARAGGRTSTKSRGAGSRTRRSTGNEMAEGEAKPTKDLEEIRAWAEARGGVPARVCGTGNENDPGLLRIDFPGYSGEDSLEQISWDEWYKKFQENNLTFLRQDTTKDGRQSRFFKLVCMEEAKG
jgi:ferritin-like metal-binding protein YciE